MAKAHDNHLHIHRKDNVTSSEFDYNDAYNITKGQPFNGVTVGNITGQMTDIDVNAGRKGSKEVAQWYIDSVGRDSTHMIHTMGGDAVPEKLNFAIKGTLTINGNAFEVCIGQGHHGDNNNWHLASQALKADANNKSGTIGNSLTNSFRITQTGTYGFNLSQSKEKK